MGTIIKFKTASEIERDDMKKRICDAIDEGDWFVGITYSLEDDKEVILCDFDIVKHRIFAKGMLHHAIECLHDYTTTT
jgi:hypothetical protein